MYLLLLWFKSLLHLSSISTSSKADTSHYRLWKSLHPKLASTVTPNVISLLLTSSLGRSLRILSPLHTIVMCVLSVSCLWSLPLFPYIPFIFIFVLIFDNYVFKLQVPHVNRTDYQLIDISEDGFVCAFIPLSGSFLYFWLMWSNIAAQRYRWVCLLTMVTPRMTSGFLLMKICFHWLVI